MPDVEEEIIAAVNALRARYDHLFTTGGIGPTHDDITADCVAKAFGVSIDVDPRAVEMLLQRIKREDLNEARLRMARIPQGADLIVNPISRAPGFRIGNVVVMAGVPAIMQAMLDNVVPGLVKGVPVTAITIEAARAFPRASTRRGSARSPPPSRASRSAPTLPMPRPASRTRSSCVDETCPNCTRPRRASGPSRPASGRAEIAQRKRISAGRPPVLKSQPRDAT